jgi:hypothetical protein
MTNSLEALIASTKQLSSLMVERFSMNPISAKLLNEAWKKEFSDDVAVAKRLNALIAALEQSQNAEEVADLLRDKVKRLESDIWDSQQLVKVKSENQYELECKVRELEERNNKNNIAWSSREDKVTEKLEAAEKHIAELEAAAVKPVELPSEFYRIGESLRTQDNRITSHPVFIVFQKIEMVVSEEHDHDRIAWVWECGDGEVEDRIAKRLEALHQGGRDTREYSRYAMKSINRFVTACFTEDGCKDYLQQNGHNLNEPFIFVHSAYRNDEWQAIRNWLMTVGCAVDGK